MKIDPRTAVIVGVGQQIGMPSGGDSPLDLMHAAIDRAIADCRAPALQDAVDLFAVARTGTVRYANAAHLLALRRGLPSARTLQSDFGGHMAQLLVGHVARAIQEGRCDVAVVAGGEAGVGLKRGGTDSGEAEVGDLRATPQPEAIGDDIADWISHPAETARGMSEPIQVYPLLETAIAWRHGQSLREHMGEVARMWAGFSLAASENRHAADRQPHSAAEILAASPANRYVGFPYTKLMNSNQFVDQGCALVLCSQEAADAAGIPHDRRIYPAALVQAHSTFVSLRNDLSAAPSLVRAGEALTALTGVRPDQHELVDLYACFPSAVQIQAEALGLAVDRPWTVTGGMRFAGGPWNSYALHMIANLVERLRERPEALALCSANGGLASRFSLASYSGRPVSGGFRQDRTIFELGGDEICPLDEAPVGEARIEAFSVSHGRDNVPREAFVASRTAAGARAWAHLTDRDMLETLLAMDQPGGRLVFGRHGARVRA